MMSAPVLLREWEVLAVEAELLDPAVDLVPSGTNSPCAGSVQFHAKRRSFDLYQYRVCKETLRSYLF